MVDLGQRVLHLIPRDLRNAVMEVLGQHGQLDPVFEILSRQPFLTTFIHGDNDDFAPIETGPRRGRNHPGAGALRADPGRRPLPQRRPGADPAGRHRGRHPSPRPAAPDRALGAGGQAGLALERARCGQAGPRAPGRRAGQDGLRRLSAVRA
ncbi:MAG: hypothetical protein WDM92_09770 [Caulobacteraceae bacterium]